MDAYQAWHCGNENADCHGKELDEQSDGDLYCPECGRVYDSNDGHLTGVP